jgi:hypothetical protein
MTIRHKFSIAAFALACATSPVAAQDLALRDLVVAPTAAYDHVVRPQLEAWFENADATYALGQALRLFVRPSEDGYLSAFAIGPTGDVTQLYPNAFHTGNYARAGEAIEVPGSGARALVRGPVGLERIRLVFTRRADLVHVYAPLAGASPFPVVLGGIAALQRDLVVVAEAAPTDAVVTLDKTFQSVQPSYGVASNYAIVVDASLAEAPDDDLMAVVPARGYPLPRY